MRKSIYLFNELESEKVIEFRPPLFFNFRGGHTSSTFSYSCSFLRYAFLGSKFTFQNTDFWEKSFCTAVSIPKSFHMTMEALCSEIHQPTLVLYAACYRVTHTHMSMSICYMSMFISNRKSSWLYKSHAILG